MPNPNSWTTKLTLLLASSLTVSHDWFELPIDFVNITNTPPTKQNQPITCGNSGEGPISIENFGELGLAIELLIWLTIVLAIPAEN